MHNDYFKGGHSRIKEELATKHARSAALEAKKDKFSESKKKYNKKGENLRGKLENQ
jgi:hypothetical protein